MNDSNRNISDILKCVKDGTIKNIPFGINVTLADLMTVDELGVTYLEYACKNDISLSFSIMDEISNNKDALYICAKHDALASFFSFPNEDLLFDTIDGNQKIIDIALANSNGAFLLWISKIKNHPEIIDYLIKYDYGHYSTLSKEVVNSLFVPQNNSFPIEKYLDNDKLVGQLLSKADFELLYNYYQLSGNEKALKYLGEDDLLRKLDDGKILLEEMIDSGIDPEFYGYDFTKPEIIDILVRKNRFDLLYNADINLLLSSYDSDKTYFDLMIKAYNEGIDVHFEKLSFSYYKHSASQTAQELMIMAKNGIIGFVPRINDYMLLYKGSKEYKSVLEYLLELDKDVTLNTIIPKDLLRDKDFVFTLKTMGIDVGSLDIKSEEIDFSDEFLKSYNDEYAKGCESPCEEKLAELHNLFLSDGESDKKIVDALVSAYRYSTSTGSEYAIMELQQLIEIKKKVPEFFYKADVSGGYFSPKDGSVHMDAPVIGTVNHETSHALHYYLANMAVPDDYYELIERVRSDPETIKRVQEYSLHYNEIKKEVTNSVSYDEIANYYDSKYTGKTLLDLARFLSASKEEQKEKYKDEFPDEVLDTVLAKSYSVSQFIEERKKLEVYEVVDSKLRNDHDAFIAIGDILDAIYLGKYRNGVLKNDDQNYIDSAFGHGIKYYSNSIHGFDEMIANFGSILKSKNSAQAMEMLRYITGDELVDVLDDYYKHVILESDVYINVEGKVEKGNAR